MNNQQAADLFNELADRLDLAGELPFKSAAYRKTASALLALEEPFTKVVAEGRFELIPGAGKAIKEKLIRLISSGRLEALEKWRQHETGRFFDLLAQTGVKPAALARLIKLSGAATEEQLLEFCADESKCRRLPDQMRRTAELLRKLKEENPERH